MSKKPFKLFSFAFLLIPSIVFSNNTWDNIGPEIGVVTSIAASHRDSIIIIGTQSNGIFYKNNNSQKWTDYVALNELNELNTTYITSNIETLGSGEIVYGIQEKLVKSNLRGSSEIIFVGVTGIISTVVVDPIDSDNLFIGFIYGYGGMIGNPGIFHTQDGGKNWIQLNDGLENVNIIDIRFLPHTRDTLIATTTTGIYKKQNFGESNWEKTGDNFPPYLITSIALDTTNYSIIYLGTTRGVFKSTNKGQTWFEITDDCFQNKLINMQSLKVFGDNCQVIMAGTQNGLYRSKDGGTTWKPVHSGLLNTSIRAISIVTYDHVLLGTSDGFYFTNNCGESWEQKNKGLNAALINDICFDDRQIPSNLIIGTQGAGIYRFNTLDGNWYDTETDYGFSAITDIDRPSSTPEIIYASYIGVAELNQVEFGIKKSFDYGFWWMPIYNVVKGNQFAFTCIVTDPANDNIVYAGTMNENIYKSIDGGFSWAQKNSGLESSYIYSMAIDPHDSHTIYAGATDNAIDGKHGIYKSVDGGESWNFMSIGFPLDVHLFIRDICINPKNPETIYVAMENYGIFKTEDGANSWRCLNRTLGQPEQYFIKTMAIDPIDTNRIYAAGNRVYRSPDAGLTWQVMMNGLPNYLPLASKIRVDPVDPDYIFLCTEGSGVFRYHHTHSGIADTGDEINSPTSFFLYHNFPNPFNPHTEIRYRVATQSHVTITIYNVQGQKIRTLVNQSQTAGLYQAHWDGTDDFGMNVCCGVYLYQMKAENWTETQKMILLE